MPASPAYSEAGTIAGRLALKLECHSIALVGCARAELIASLPDLPLAGWDTAEHIDAARRLEPTASWTVGGVAAIAELCAPFAVLAARLLLDADEPTLSAILAAVPAALVIDTDATRGRGPSALLELVEQARARGVTVFRSELIAGIGTVGTRRTSPAVLIGDGHDPTPGRLAAGGLHGLRLEPHGRSSTGDGQSTRICMVSCEFAGPAPHGGIGTANAALAHALVQAGHDVTLIYTGPSSQPAAYARRREELAERGLTYLEPPSDRVAAVGNPFVNQRVGWCVLEMILELHERQPFDVIHGPESQGHLMFVALAKQHGIGFAGTEVVCGLHSPVRYALAANDRPLSSPDSLVIELMERLSAEAADVVVSPSGYLLAWVRSRGWRLPERSYVQPSIRSEVVQQVLLTPSTAAEDEIDEIVFFGRLDAGKGIEAFCRALDDLSSADAPDVSITFLGRESLIRGQISAEYINAQALTWPWPVRVLADLSHGEAVHYLRSRRCLAVMPSLVDNSPNTVSEAIALGIPFVVSRSGGIAELISLQDLDRCSFAGWPEDDDRLEPLPPDADPRAFDHAGLTRLIRQRTHEPGGPVHPAIDPGVNETCHLDWHRTLIRRLPEPVGGRRPTLSTIATHGPIERGLNHQPEMIVTLDEPDPARHSAPGWAMTVGGDRTVAGAYNEAARVATGELLLFLPAGVTPRPGMEDALRTAASRSDADFFLYALRGGTGGTVVPTCGPPLLALRFPVYDGIGFAARAEVIHSLGGFSTTDRSRDPSTELLIRAGLAGRRVEVIPAILADRDDRVSDGYVQESELLRPFIRASGALADLPALYHSPDRTAPDSP